MPALSGNHAGVAKLCALDTRIVDLDRAETESMFIQRGDGHLAEPS